VAAVKGEAGLVATATSLPPITQILVVEGFQPFRDFIKSVIRGETHLHVACEARDGLDAVQKAKELRPDSILLDIGLPRLNGIEVARQISHLTPRPKIVFVSQESSAEIIQEALSAGGIGYVLKPRAASDLLAAIEAALQGRKFVSDTARVAGRRSGPNRAGLEPGTVKRKRLSQFPHPGWI